LAVKNSFSLLTKNIYYSIFSETLCKMFVISAISDRRRPVTSLRHQEGRRVFREGPKFFELRPIFLKYVQHIFPGGANNFLGGPWLRAWTDSRVLMLIRFEG